MYEAKRIARILQKEDNFLITSHIRPDGDSIGSQLALFIILKELGKKACIVNTEAPPEMYQFLPFVDKIYLFKKDKDRISKEFSFDVICILDCCEWERLGDELAEWLQQINAIRINIDHHIGTGIGNYNYNYIDTNASATGEQIYKIYNALWQRRISYELALNLYVAIVTDTRLFKQVNTTAEAHRIVAHLIECGVVASDISRRLFEDISPEGLKIIGKACSTFRTALNNKIIWCCIDVNKIKIEIDPEKIIEELWRIKSSEVIILFRKIGKDKVKVSLRSKKPHIDVSQVAIKFDGGGHPQAAGCIIEGNIKKAQVEIINQIKKLLQ